MKGQKIITGFGGISALTLFVVGACGGSGTADIAGEADLRTIPDDPSAVRYTLGSKLANLSGQESKDFDDGLVAFSSNEGPDDGLGPVFNGESCGQCHFQGAIGGAGNDLALTRVTRIGGIVNGKYSDLEDLGGPVIQSRSNREFNPAFPHSREFVPAEAKFVSLRITTPLFGLGLIEAIPQSAIVARSQQRFGDGVSGTVNWVTNPATNTKEVGRFGWKAQVSSIEVFAADAYLNEMGITTPLFSTEQKPQGHTIAPGADPVGDPEDAEDVELFISFMKFLAPPTRSSLSIVAQRGEKLFGTTGCANCHAPQYNTGLNANPALSNQNVNLYSDLLVHKMGSGLADGIIQGSAQGDQFRTAPLWGLSKRKFLLHDGRATTVDAAVGYHGGEASIAAGRYFGGSEDDRTAIREFLKSL
ncbi:MAG: di-heme oxidoredictase family protein [Armatimonadota bacterium]